MVALYHRFFFSYSTLKIVPRLNEKLALSKLFEPNTGGRVGSYPNSPTLVKGMVGIKENP